jgi:signal transduction histidine kinase/ActR/RegA family two-component response regulator
MLATGLGPVGASADSPPEPAARTVRVGVYQNKPKVFMEPDGEASGLFIELLEAVADREGWSLEFVPCRWSGCLEAVLQGRIDLMPDVAYTRERDRTFSFHQTPVIESWSQVFARSDADIRTLSDLDGLRIAALRDSIQEASFRQMIAGFGIRATIVPTESLEEAFEAVRDGAAEAAIANHMFGDYFHGQYGLVRTAVVFEVAELYFATADGRNGDLLQGIDRHLSAWIREPNSPYYATLARWMDRPPVGLVPPRILWTIGIAIGLLVLAVGVILVLRSQVRSRTRRLLQVNEELRQAQKMEAIGKLAGGVAHDFNNQLTVILSYAELALGRMRETDPGHHETAEIAAAARRAAVLTQQLLAFSRKQVMEIRPVDLNQTARGLEPMLRRILGEDIALKLDLAPGLGHVLADAGQLEQVLMNLVVNARDAMPAGGTLTIGTAASRTEDTLAGVQADMAPGPCVLWTVADTGLGMDEATRVRVFEPFFTTKERGKGTGLGLSTVYGIVKQSGGHIWVLSRPGQGTTFHICLPEAPEATPAGAEPPQPAPRTALTPHGTETILLAEDEAPVRALATQALRAAGFTVLSAGDSDEALGLARQHAGDIHLLVTDLIMPGISGAALARQVVDSRPDARVLFMSGYADDDAVRHGVLEPGARFIGKPFATDALVRKVRETLDGA